MELMALYIYIYIIFNQSLRSWDSVDFPEKLILNRG